MKENKKKIVESFTPVIRQTRVGSDVARLEYCLKNGDEVVDVTFVIHKTPRQAVEIEG